MKVTCEYCNSYVEADENLKCPNCQAPLGDAVRAEEARIKAEEEAQRQKEAEEAEEQAQKEAVGNVLKGIAGVASAAFLGSNRSRDRRMPPPPNNGPMPRNDRPQHGQPPRDGHRPDGPRPDGHRPDGPRPDGHRSDGPRHHR